MNIEILFALRTLHKVTKAPPLEDLQYADLDKSYRKILLRTFKKNIISKYLFFLEIFRIYIFIILKKNITGSNTNLMMMYCTKNQERQIDYIKNIIPDNDYLELNLKGQNSFRVLKNFNFIDFTKSFISAVTLYRILFDKYDAVDLKNFIIFISMYVQTKIILEKSKPKAILVANDHSVTPMAFAAAARSMNIKTIYIQHAHITHVMPPLRFNTAILDGKCALDVYRKCGEIKNIDILYRGIEGVSNPMDVSSLSNNQKINVGIFINVCEEENLFNLINTLLENDRIENILIREHPAFPLKTSKSLPDKVRLSQENKTLLEDAERCDLIIGGNSSFHLSVLKYGKPCILYNQLDYLEFDEYGFIKHDICYEMTDANEINLSNIADYYANNAWQERFRYFDATYLKSQDSYDEDIKNYILNTALE